VGIALKLLVQHVVGARITGDDTRTIENVEYDSRLVKPNGLFFAIRGYTADGYDFVKQARDNGAVAVLGARERCDDIDTHVSVPDDRAAMADVSAAFYGFPGRALEACGVTGTNGKTTTCFIIRKILEADGRGVGLITSLEYDTGHEVFRAERTTPESLDTQRMLYLMKRSGCRNAVLETSSHALSMHRVDNIDFRVGVFTNLTRDHLDYHHTMEEYLAAKMKLLEFLKGDFSYAVINLDVEEFRPVFDALQSAHLTFSVDNKAADVYGRNHRLEPGETSFVLVTPLGERKIRLPLPGRFNLSNAIAAAAASLAFGAELDSVAAGLQAVQPVPGRMETIEAGQPFAVYVDYAHTPDALRRLCESVREINDGRILLLFGCGGDRDRGKRPEMGRAAMDNAGFAVVTLDNPRSEDPSAIIEDIKPALDMDRCRIVEDRREAIETILRTAKPRDAVLLAGKGAEPYQEIGGERYPFDDREVAREILAEMGFTTQADVEK
jgi:UDP-N-acetylmuramoyl-L-alanyl-D-glutamate--2,6-diaminopimelate ligase